MNKLTKVHRLLSAYRYSPAALSALWETMRTRRLPNTRQANRAQWGSYYDWSAEGDEWSYLNVPGWKESVVEKLLVPFVNKNHAVLEVGPGAGRWTEYLVQRAAKVILVDVTPECIDMCREKFASRGNLEFHVNDGKSLGMVDSFSVDRIWSFDVFVHIRSADVDSYVAEFERILTPGGRALIHHSKSGSTSAHTWRSDMTAERMCQIVERHGLELINQFESWGDDGQRLCPTLRPADNVDIISVFGKPA